MEGSVSVLKATQPSHLLAQVAFMVYRQDAQAVSVSSQAGTCVFPNDGINKDVIINPSIIFLYITSHGQALTATLSLCFAAMVYVEQKIRFPLLVVPLATSPSLQNRATTTGAMSPPKIPPDPSSSLTRGSLQVGPE